MEFLLDSLYLFLSFIASKINSKMEIVMKFPEKTNVLKLQIFSFSTVVTLKQGQGHQNQSKFL